MDKSERKYKQLFEEEKKLNEKLARDIEKIKTATRDSRNRLQQAYDELSHEMDVANSVQAGLLPEKLPRLPNVDISALYIPTEKVSGDLYDVIITQKKKIVFLIFDVSGHGVPSALICAMAKMLFSQYVELDISPADIFTKVNRQISRYVKTGHYLTAFLGVLDPLTNKMTYSIAGHVPPIRYNHETGKIDMLNGKGIIIGHPGLIDAAKYYNFTISLDWNDKLLFYTDGLTESLNTNDEMYGKTRLEKILKKNGRENPGALNDIILKDNVKFRNGRKLDDDISLLTMELGIDQELLKESGLDKDELPVILTLKSDGEIEDNCSVILRELDRYGYPSLYYYRIHLCLHEMMSNALRHGNRKDSKKTVYVFYSINLKRLKVSVVDEGEGFDYTDLPDPLDMSNLTKENGRGLFIINKYMDKVEFNKKGNRILAEKRFRN